MKEVRTLCKSDVQSENQPNTALDFAPLNYQVQRLFHVMSESSAAMRNDLAHHGVGCALHGRLAGALNDDELDVATFGFFIQPHVSQVMARIVLRVNDGRLRGQAGACNQSS